MYYTLSRLSTNKGEWPLLQEASVKKRPKCLSVLRIGVKA